MVYWTSLDKEEVLDLLEEKDDILYLLEKNDILDPLGLGKNRRNLVSLQKGWYTLPPWKMMIYWTPLVGKQEIPGLLGEKMIYWTPLEIQKIFDIVGTKEEVLEPPFEELFFDINFKFYHF